MMDGQLCNEAPDNIRIILKLFDPALTVKDVVGTVSYMSYWTTFCAAYDIAEDSFRGS